jgi:hypothetical protein
VVCPASNSCFDGGTCDPKTGSCSSSVKADGTGCDDGNACTTSDTCAGGACGGRAVVCTASDAQHEPGTCSSATGVCSNPLKPTISVGTLPQYTNQIGQTLSVTVGADLAIASVSCTDNGTVVYGPVAPAPGTLSVQLALFEGPNSITCQVTDVAGYTATASASSYLSTVAPTTTPDQPLPPYTNGTRYRVRVRWAGDLDVVEHECFSNGVMFARGPVINNTLAPNFPLVEGPNFVEVCGIDLAGNRGCFSGTITVDTVAPTVDFDPFPAITNAGSLTLGGGIGDGGGGGGGSGIGGVSGFVNGVSVPISFGGGRWSGTFPLRDGLNEIEIDVTDGAGNVNKKKITCFHDATPPTVVCPTQIPTECTTGGAPLQYEGEAAADESGIASFECLPLRGAILPSGHHMGVCNAVDTAGNGASCTFDIVIGGGGVTITCPADRVEECTAGGAQATGGATASNTCGGTATVSCQPATGALMPVGTTTNTCTASDGAGNQAECRYDVTVRDTLAPVVTPKPDVELWPPNHKYVTVTLADCIGSITDQCDGSLDPNTAGEIVRVTSDEPEELARKGGDGRTCRDMVLVDKSSVQLRAEREGPDNGRIYTIHYVVRDKAGHAVNGTCRANVPHDQNKPPVDNGPSWCVGDGCGELPGYSLSCR